MSLEIFLLLLLIVSIFTGLFTEGIKKLMDEVNKKYLSNFLAGFVAVVLSVLVDAGYIILTEAQVFNPVCVETITLRFQVSDQAASPSCSHAGLSEFLIGSFLRLNVYTHLSAPRFLPSCRVKLRQ